MVVEVDPSSLAPVVEDSPEGIHAGEAGAVDLEDSLEDSTFKKAVYVYVYEIAAL
jgi:hypothetical protein